MSSRFRPAAIAACWTTSVVTKVEPNGRLLICRVLRPVRLGPLRCGGHIGAIPFAPCFIDISPQGEGVDVPVLCAENSTPLHRLAVDDPGFSR